MVPSVLESMHFWSTGNIQFNDQSHFRFIADISLFDLMFSRKLVFSDIRIPEVLSLSSVLNMAKKAAKAAAAAPKKAMKAMKAKKA